VSREDHRRYDELLQQIRAQQKPPETVTPGDIALWCLAGVMAVALYLAPEKTPVWVCIGLVCMAALATHPVLNIPFVKKRHSVSTSGIAILLMLSLVAMYGWFVWPPRKYYSLLTKENIEKFSAIARKQTKPKETLIVRCPVTSEDLCAIATAYLEVLQKSGWRTPTGGIDRGSYAKSFTGITLSKKPQPGTVDPNNPNQGLWVLQSDSLVTIRDAFEALGMKTKISSEQQLPEDTICIYFGPAPEQH
jgi:hypothetical protein